ncbi:MAG: O-antigen ligase family protein [Tannerellaceae bacterium]|nr:O-antigen ligase family protein [Tannerellaceae bacterium]
MTVRGLFSTLSLLLIVCLSTFAGYLGVKYTSVILCCAFLFGILLAFMSNISGFKYKIKAGIPTQLIPWLLFLIFVFISYRTNMLGSTRILTGILLCIALKNNSKWLKQVIYIIATITGLNVFFTIFFYFFPQYYNLVIDAYGFIPTGTSAGSAGYRAGISDHYSQNGIYISIFALMIISILFAINASGNKSKRKTALVCAILAYIALLLTSKRAVLVFSIIALAATYLISSKRKMDRILRLAIVCLVVFGLLQVFSEMIPALSYVVERFQSIGDDTGSIERLAMWQLALSKFLEKPIFGHGLWSYREFYYQELGTYFHPYETKYQYLNAHNVYLQLLCETGIVGLLIYISAIVISLYRTICLVRQLNRFDDIYTKAAVMFSLSMQLFYCIYSLTGNCLYDIVFPFYGIALAIAVSVDYNSNPSARRVLSIR